MPHIKGRTRDDGIAVTGAGKLACQKVIHLEIPPIESNNDWKTAISRCLQEAEKLGLTSISFPAFGTGINDQVILQSIRLTSPYIQTFVV